MMLPDAATPQASSVYLGLLAPDSTEVPAEVEKQALGLDANNDGVLSASEWMAWIKKQEAKSAGATRWGRVRM